jgi:hypothetical protein
MRTTYIVSMRPTISSTTISDLARETFKVLSPWLNLYCAGYWTEYMDGKGQVVTGPRYFITKELLDLYGRWKNGETDLRYENGYRFQPWHFHANRLQPKHVQEMLDGLKCYSTGGRDGRMLFMLDGDAHKPWQIDAPRASRLLADVLGVRNLFHVDSARGFNDHLKLDYHPEPWAWVNMRLKEFGDACHLFLKSQGVLTDLEVKGLICLATARHPEEPFGTLAKLPCYGDWSFQRLEEFKNTQVVSLNWIINRTRELRSLTDPEKVKATIARCRELEGKPFVIRSRPTPTPIRVATSTSLFTEEELEALASGKVRKHLYDRINYVYAMHHKPKKQGVCITKDDVYMAWVVFDFIARHPNKDNKEPGTRAEAIWTYLHDQDPVAFPRAWDNSRWAALRNTLADCQFLLEVDSTYWFHIGKTGKMGKPMQWYLKEAYCIDWQAVMLNPEEEGKTSIREVFPPFVPENWRPTFLLPGKVAYHKWTEEKLTEFLLSCAA